MYGRLMGADFNKAAPRLKKAWAVIDPKGYNEFGHDVFNVVRKARNLGNKSLSGWDSLEMIGVEMEDGQLPSLAGVNVTKVNEALEPWIMNKALDNA